MGGTYCGCYSTTQTTQSPRESVANPNLQVDVNRWVAPIVDAVGGTYCGCHPTTQTTQSPGEAVANSNLQVDVNRWVAPIVDASGWHVLWMLRDQRAAFYLRCAVEVTKDQPLNRTRPTQNASYKMLANGIQ